VNEGTILDKFFELHLFHSEDDGSCPEVGIFNCWLNAAFWIDITGILNSVVTHFERREQNEY
jgi:hypothetical protein